MSMESYYELVERETVEESRRSGRSLRAVLCDRWPNRDDRIPFFKWVTAKGDRAQEELFAPVSPENLRQKIDTTNYNNQDQRASLVNSCLRITVPWFPAGVDAQDDYYRIVPHPYALLPDQEPPPTTDREILAPSVLGVNINVQPLHPVHRRVANYPEESTQLSNESDDTSTSGFVFHQLGIVEIWEGDPDLPKTEENLCDGPWGPTDFGVVVKIDRNGAPGGIYIIYDFYRGDLVTGKRPSKRHDIAWGNLGEMTNQFSVAKIADTFSELGFHRTLSPTIIADHPIELVRVVVGGNNTLLRATIMDNQ